MVKRWNNWCGVTHGHRMQEQPGGLYVTFDDYDALAARLAELVELLTVNPNAYASDILDAWTPASSASGEGER